MTEDNKPMIVQGEIVPAEQRAVLHMPTGTPLGLGVFGAMRFDAIRRVLDHYTIALQSAVLAVDAEEEYKRRLAARDGVRELSLHIEAVRAIERLKIRTEADRLERTREIEALQHELARLELQTKIAEQSVLLERAKGKLGTEEPELEAAKDDYDRLIQGMQRLPGIAEAYIATRDGIVAKFGGEDKLGDDGKQMIETLNAFMSGAIQKRVEEQGP
jgi:hypothetical protein